MKRVPPSVRLKAEIERTLQGGEGAIGSPEPPMVGFVGRLARYMLQVAIEAEATPSSVGSITAAGHGSVSGGATAVS